MTVTHAAAEAMAVDSLRHDADRVAGILRAAGCRDVEVEVRKDNDPAVGALLAGPITTTVTVTLRFAR